MFKYHCKRSDLLLHEYPPTVDSNSICSLRRWWPPGGKCMRAKHDVVLTARYVINCCVFGERTLFCKLCCLRFHLILPFFRFSVKNFYTCLISLIDATQTRCSIPYSAEYVKSKWNDVPWYVAVPMHLSLPTA